MGKFIADRLILVSVLCTCGRCITMPYNKVTMLCVCWCTLLGWVYIFAAGKRWSTDLSNVISLKNIHYAKIKSKENNHPITMANFLLICN